MNDRLQEAIKAIKSGDKQAGREILAEIIKSDRNNEQAWLWVTQTDITHEQKIKSLQRVLRINPDNENAKQGLIKLQEAQPQKPTSAPKGGLFKKSPSASKPVKTTEQAAPSPPIQDTKQCPYCAETIKAEAVVCRFCEKDLRAKDAVSQKPKPEKKKRSTIADLALFGVFSVALVCACLIFYSPSTPGTNQQESSSGAAKPFYVWVDGFENCPTHSEFGKQVVNRANTYKADGSARFIYIPHGTRVEVIGKPDEFFYRIRWNGEITYIQTLMTQPQPPYQGVVPKSEDCL